MRGAKISHMETEKIRIHVILHENIVKKIDGIVESKASDENRLSLQYRDRTDFIKKAVLKQIAVDTNTENKSNTVCFSCGAAFYLEPYEKRSECPNCQVHFCFIGGAGRQTMPIPEDLKNKV